MALSRSLTSLVIARSFLILRGEVSSAGLTVHTDERAKRLSAVEWSLVLAAIKMDYVPNAQNRTASTSV